MPQQILLTNSGYVYITVAALTLCCSLL